MAKAPRKGGKGSAPKKGAKPAKGKKPAAKKPIPKAKPTRAPKGKGGYEVICSECYTSFHFGGGGGGDITCPECLHAGQPADSAAMSDMAMAKSGESSKFMMAMIAVLLFFAVGLGYAYTLTSKAQVGEALDQTTNYIFLGCGALLFIVMVALSMKYESSRYDVYF